MKKALLTLMCMVAMMAAGTSLKAQEITITLTPGWNWISYTNAVSMGISAALGDFTPVQGDIIKSKSNGTTTYNGTMWRGTLSQFMPGQGYKYFSTRNEAITFVFAQAPSSYVTTSDPTDIHATSAVVGSIVAIEEGNHIYARGVCWDTMQMPTVDDNHTSDGAGTGAFITTLMGLTASTTYYVRAYVVTDYGLVYGEEVNFTTLDTSNNVPEGAISGLFTINGNGDQVYFSQGNLQYQASTNTWRFAEHQWNYVGGNESDTDYGNVFENDVKCNNSLISSNYDGWIDLFGWGTSGWNCGNTYYQPWDFDDSDGSLYGPPGNYNLTDSYSNSDWGIYNAISNGGNICNTWRTLKQFEWDYVFFRRSTSSGIRYAKAQVNNVNGVILLPDDWINNIYSLNSTNSGGASFSSNVISAIQWTTLENAGAVFIPAAGWRDGTSGCYVTCSYWSASCVNYNIGLAHFIGISENNIETFYSASRFYGRSVRLVRNAE